MPKAITEKTLTRMEQTMETLSSGFEMLTKSSKGVSGEVSKQIKALREIKDSLQDQISFMSQRKKTIKEINTTIKELEAKDKGLIKVFKGAARDSARAFKELGEGILESIDDILDTFFGPLWKFTKRLFKGVALFGRDIGRAIFGGGKGRTEEEKQQIDILTEIRDNLLKQDPRERLRELSDKFSQEMSGLNQYLMQSDKAKAKLTKELQEQKIESEQELARQAVKGKGGKGKGMLAGLLGGGGLASKFLKGAGIFALIAAGVVWMIKDFITGFKLGGVGKGIAMAFAGTGKGLKGAFKNMGKFALIGAGIGLIAGPLGALVGGLIGAGFGLLMNLIGTERIEKAFNAVKTWWKSGGLGKIADWVKDIGLQIWDVLKKIPDILKGIWDFSVKVIEAIESGLDAFADFVMGIPAAFSRFGEWIVELNQSMNEAIDGAIAWIKELPGKIVDFFKNLTWEDVLKTAINIVKWETFLIQKIWDWIKGIPGKIWDWITGQEIDKDLYKKVLSGMKEQTRQQAEGWGVLPPGKKIQETPAYGGAFGQAVLGSMGVTGQERGAEIVGPGLVQVHTGEQIRPADFVKFEAQTLKRTAEATVKAIKDAGKETTRAIQSISGQKGTVNITTAATINDIALLAINSGLL